jgi:alpha-amylase
MTNSPLRGKFSSLTRRSYVKRLSTAAAAVTVGGSTFAAPASAAGEPVALQYFDYGDYGPEGNHWARMRDEAGSLGSAGYDRVWVQSPAKPNTDNSNGYNPQDFLTWNGSLGEEWEFDQMVDALGNNGVGVIVDSVINHTGTTDPDEGVYPQFPDRSYFHEPKSTSESRLDGQLYGLWDLEHEDGRVTDQLYRFVKKVADKGCAGYRWDAAKHVPKWWFRDYGNPWANDFGMFKVGEVYDGNPDFVEDYANTDMNVFDYPLHYTLKSAFQYGGNLSEVADAVRNDNSIMGRQPWRSSPFVDNHDDDPPENNRLAYAFILTAPGYPFVFSNHAKSEGVDYDADWLTNLIWIKNNLAGGDMYFRHDSQNLLITERYNNLLTGINQSGNWQSQWVYTSWRNQTLKDYSGSSGDVWVNGDGWVELDIPPGGWVCYAP